MNHQHLWLLATAFEAFERYLIGLYGSLGYLDRTFWPAAHFGEITLDQLSRRRPAWYLQCARQVARRNTSEIRKVVESQLPSLRHRRANNQLGDLTFWLPVIETFRHVIVHSQGRAAETALLESVAKATGRSFAGPATIALKRAVLQFTRSHGTEREIWLVDPKDAANRTRFVKPFSRLLQVIASEGALIHTESMERFGHSVTW